MKTMTANALSHTTDQRDTLQSVAANTGLHDKSPLISEVIVPNFNNSNPIVLPMVAALSQQTSIQSPTKWTTWITHRTPSKSLLQTMGTDLSRLRIVHIKNTTDARWIVWQALAQGNSHTVIAEQSYWDKKDINDMETAAKQGGTLGVLVTICD